MENTIVAKLRKLIAHERSARSIGSLAEAESFAAKIQDLLTAHKLSMSEVDFQTREDGEPIDWERVDGSELNVGGRRTKTYWRVSIAHAIAKVNSCEVVNDTRSRGMSFFFVGRTSDRELAKILYLYLIELGEELVVKSARADREDQIRKFSEHHHIHGIVPSWAKAAFNSWMKDYRESWKMGFGTAIATRLKNQYEESLKAQAAESTAMIHIKKDALAVRTYLARKIKAGRSVSGRARNDDGYARGKSTGEAVNLSPTRLPERRAARLLGA